MESFKSRQFTAPQPSAPIKPMKLNSHARKLYPELSSLLDLQAKQERLRKLQLGNGGNLNSQTPHRLTAKD